jgi:O-acetyl-ADP-ribose deacetylase (regulator of RNase III)
VGYEAADVDPSLHAPRYVARTRVEEAVMKRVQGDLLQLALQGSFDVVVHGCNCQHAMGAGIAYTLKSAFPEVYEADLRTPRGERDKLGSIVSVPVAQGGVSFVVVNGYTQFHYRGDGVLVEYDALRRVMRAVKEQYAGKRIAYPRIGVGMARGDWTLICAIITRALDGEDHTLVELPDP